MNTNVLVVIVVVAITSGALLSALTSALEKLGTVTLRAMAESDATISRIAQRILDRGPDLRDRLLIARITCIAIATTSGLAIGEPHGAKWFVISGMVVILAYAFTAQLAASIANRRASVVALYLVRFLRPVELILVPFSWPMSLIRKLIEKNVPEKEPPYHVSERMTELAVEQVIEQGEESGSIDESQAELLWNVLEFERTFVREIMVPRINVVSFAIDTPIAEVLEAMVEAQHSRYPVYQQKMDQVIGTLVAKDLFAMLQKLGALDQVRLENIVRRPAFFVAEARKISDVLKAMQSKHIHLAVVTDEFGGMSGIVTIEDILEEIVGEIQDEHDEEEPAIRELGQDKWLVLASTTIDEIEEQLQVHFSSEEIEEVESIGGLIVHLMGRVPLIGEELLFNEMKVHIRQADERKIISVEIERTTHDDSENKKSD